MSISNAASACGVSVVIPALNEAGCLRDVLERIHRIFRETDSIYEIIVVDDGSTDATGAIAGENGARVIRHPERSGYGRSLKHGISAAQHDTIIISDADGTYPLERIPDMLRLYYSGYNMVVAARQGEYYRQSCYKSFLRTVLRFLVEWAGGKKIADVNSGFRIFSKKEVLPFFPQLCDTFSFTTSLTLLYVMQGLFVGYLPVAYSARVGKSHVRLFSDSLRTLAYILKEILYFDPLKIFFLFAFFWLFFGAAAFCVSAIFSINFGYYMVIFSIFGAFILTGLGLIAEQLRQLLINKNNQDH